MQKRFIYLVIFILFVSTVSSNEKYSFEKAEELAPLIKWNDYGEDAFSLALEENKPIFLLLTAPSWCYWCQVYESEEYLFHPDMVEYVNEKTIPIYVDADKRADLTRQYLEGGWPSTTILTPGGERLYGYSGPRPVPNMLENLKNAVSHVQTISSIKTISYDYEKKDPVIPSANDLQNLINSYASNSYSLYDSIHGGFGNGQKFPQGRTLDYFLELYELSKDIRLLNAVKVTLVNQYTNIEHLTKDYNLFDPVEGGFHRYGTARDWSPPHYEKMLYDNARLLKSYYHLQKILPEDELVKEVVDKTLSFVLQNWYDSLHGGFYGNSDVHGEDAYYGQFPRSLEKPRVEKTKYTDWNSEAIITFLYLYEESGDEKFLSIAKQSLDFYSDEIISNDGAYHYITPQGEKGVRGTIFDNSYLLLAFVNGYEITNEEKYLDDAQKIALYSLENLYDWNSGGFFERNSKDKSIYALGDSIRLTKPNQENGVMSYALLKLYEATNDSMYLGAGIKTVGMNINNIGSLDRGYYNIKSAQFVLENGLLARYENNKLEIVKFENNKLENFWLNNVLEGKAPLEFEQIQEPKLKGSIFLLLIVALFAGFISFASPCTLPIIPAYVAYSFQSSKKNILGMTLFFFLGLSTIFVLLGLGATTIGNLLKTNITFFSKIAGLVLIFFGIFILFGRGFSGFKIKQKKPTSYIGSFLLGATMGFSWTPCVGPILVAILVLAGTVGNIFSGALLLFAYSIGLALPLLLVSLFLNKINKKGAIWKIMEGKIFRIGKIKIHSNSLISGILFIILGFLIFNGILSNFALWFGSTSLQAWVFYLEGLIMRLL